MNALANALLASAALGALLLAVPGPAVSQSPPTTAYVPVKFGMDSGSASHQAAHGVKADYGTFWIGPWTLSSGWGGPDGQLDAMRNAGVTPAIHHYYWGDDISVNCLENGCWSSLHNAHKDQAGWQRLTDQLVAHLNARMQGKPVVVFLETEFNKGNVATYEPLDGMLAEKAAQIKQGYPNAKVVMSLGNWGHAYWGTWDRTAAAVDMVGVQGMRGSTRQNEADYATLYEMTIQGAKTAKAKFGLPVMVQDFALSSYPEPGWLDNQESEMRQFFQMMPELHEVGVQALIYRSWRDAPNMDTKNWYGEAERHFGLSWAYNGTLKPAGKAWIEGVKAERARADVPVDQPPVASFTASAEGLSAAFDASASSDPEGRALAYAWAFGDGATGSGRTATHAYPAEGTFTVTLTVSDGAHARSASRTLAVEAPNRPPTAAFTVAASQLDATFDAGASSDPDGDALSYLWRFGDGTVGGGRVAGHAYEEPGTYTVTLTVGDGEATATASRTVTVTLPPYEAGFAVRAANEHWEQVRVSASPAPAKVEVQANGGAWKPLALQGYGDWTGSHYIAKGSTVVFRATAPDGRTDESAPLQWIGPATTPTTSPTPTTTPSPTPSPTAYSAAFAVKAANQHWEQVRVSASPAPAKVEVQADGGAWKPLALQSYGDWTGSHYIAKGSTVVFRATAPDGRVATSAPLQWLGPATTTSTAPTPTFTASFTPKAVGNDWWVEAAVSASQPVAKVEAKVGSGPWTALPLQDWGTYAKSIHAPNGSAVTFRATSSSGAVATSAPVTWT